MARRALLLLVLWLSFVFGPSPVAAGNAAAPDVDFVILRLDFQTYAVKGGYRFTQPYRKLLRPPYGSVRVGNLYSLTMDEGEDGYTEMRSRLTGQVIARVGWAWCAPGAWEYPNSLPSPMPVGGHAPDPSSLDRIIRLGTAAQADTAWAIARQALALESLAESGPYEVVIFDYRFGTGCLDQTNESSEWNRAARSCTSRRSTPERSRWKDRLC
jgi:hypothetical protein